MYVVWCLILAFQGVLCVDFSWLFKSFGSLSEKGNVGTDAGLTNGCSLFMFVLIDCYDHLYTALKQHYC